MKNTEKRLLVIRTSAMGDVALAVPVLKGIREQYPGVKVTLVTRSIYRPFFDSVNGLEIFSPDFNGRHKGFRGILRLYSDLKKTGKYDYIIDLHDVIRSKIIRFLFRLIGVRISRIDKGRKEKRMAIRGMVRKPLPHTAERYLMVFKNAGFNILPDKGPWIMPSPTAKANANKLLVDKNILNIGVAPYAKHDLKIWPEEYMISLMRMISGKFRTRYWLFGGQEESERLRLFQQKVAGSENLSGKLSLTEELAIMAELDLMISMDSSNMHMSSLTGTKVISVWGATDPITGFGAWSQPEEYSMKIPADKLPCRPCTVFGKGTCRRGDHACMKWLTPDLVFERIMNLNIMK